MPVTSLQNPQYCTVRIGQNCYTLSSTGQYCSINTGRVVTDSAAGSPQGGFVITQFTINRLIDEHRSRGWQMMLKDLSKASGAFYGGGTFHARKQSYKHQNCVYRSRKSLTYVCGTEI